MEELGAGVDAGINHRRIGGIGDGDVGEMMHDKM